jgi:hypothetical protein
MIYNNLKNSGGLGLEPHIRKFYPNGGSPNTDILCPSGQSLDISCIHGKILISKVRERSIDHLGVKIKPMNESVISDIAPNHKELIQNSVYEI